MELSNLYKLHVIILTKNSVNYLRTCIDSIIEKRLFRDEFFSNYQIYVGDTGSSEYSKDKLKEYYNKISTSVNSVKIQPIIFDGYHFSKVNNYIARTELDIDESKTNLILFLNNDVKMLSDCVTQLVQTYHDNKERAGTIGCKLLFEDGTIQHAGQCVRSDGVPTHRGLKYPTGRFTETETVLGNTGAMLLISVDVFNKVGGFREEFDHYFQDVHLCMKCINEGLDNIYVGKAIAYHYEHKTHSKDDMQRLGRRCTEDLKGYLKDYISEHKDKFKDYILQTP